LLINQTHSDYEAKLTQRIGEGEAPYPQIQNLLAQGLEWLATFISTGWPPAHDLASKVKRYLWEDMDHYATQSHMRWYMLEAEAGDHTSQASDGLVLAHPGWSDAQASREMWDPERFQRVREIKSGTSARVWETVPALA
jgi:hypothetical protein